MNELDFIKQHASVKQAETPAKKPSQKPEVKSDWLKEVDPLMTKLGLDKGEDAITYQNSGYLMRAYSGRYDQFLNNPGVTEKAKTAIKALKKASLTFTAGVKSSNGDLIYKGYNAASNAWQEVATAFDEAGSKYKVSNDFRILDNKTFKKKDQTVKTYSTGGAETTQDDSFFSMPSNKELSNVFYQQKGLQNNWQESIKKQVKPVVKDWISKSTSRLSATDVKADEKMNAYLLSRDALLYIEKYGTENPKDKVKAKDILDKMRSANSKGWNSKLDVISKNRNAILELTDKMGFYGTSAVYKKHKDNLRKDKNYYHDSMENIDSDYEGYDLYKDLNNNIKSQVSENLKANDNFGFRSIIDDKGDLVNFKTYKNNIDKEIAAVANSKSFNSNSAIETLSKKYGIEIGALREFIGSVRINGFNDPYSKNQHNQIYSYLEDSYKQKSKTYRQEFNNIDVSTIYESSYYKAGLGNKFTFDVGYDSVDLSLDKNGNRLKDISNQKQNLVNNFFDYIFDGDKNIIKKDVILVSGKGTPYEALTPSLKNSSVTNTDKTVDMVNGNNASVDAYAFYNFFKNKDRSNIEFKFRKNVGDSKYIGVTFRDENGEYLQAFIPRTVAKDDYFYKNTNVEKNEFNFKAKGFYEFPDYNDKKPDGKRIFDDEVPPRIVIDEDNNKRLEYTLILNDGSKHNDYVVLGNNESLNIKDAKKAAKEQLNQIISILNGQD